MVKKKNWFDWNLIQFFIPLMWVFVDHIFHWFSAIGNAYAVLSDADKRKKYDVYGPDLQQASQYTSDYTHGGFEGTSSLTAIFFNFKAAEKKNFVLNMGGGVLYCNYSVPL